MQALLLTEYRKLELVSMDRPTLGPNDVLVRVAACGICGSDVHGYDGSSGRRIPPIVMGHEAAGTVAEVGAAVDRAQVGDRVTFDSTISCGQCDACRRGQVNLVRQPPRASASPATTIASTARSPSSSPCRSTFCIRCRPSCRSSTRRIIEPVSVALHAVARLQDSAAASEPSSSAAA